MLLLNFTSFLETLPVMLYGMLGIFVVMIVIAVTISVLKKVCK